MTLDEIFEMWDRDSTINRLNLVDELSQIPKLHTKYLSLYSKEKLLSKKKKVDLELLKRDKYQYYKGVLDLETQNKRGWPPNTLRILNGEVDTYISTDEDILKLNLELSYYDEKVQVLESIVKQIQNRNFIIKSMIDMIRFEAGN